MSLLETLLNNPGVDVNKANNHDNTTPFMALCANSNILPDFILKSDKFDVNAQDMNGKTALFMTVSKIDDNHDKHDIVDQLLKLNKIDPNIASNEGLTPFHAACLNLNLNNVKLLIQNDRVNITEFPANKNCMISSDVYDDDKFDELIDVLSQYCETKPEVVNVIDRLKAYVY